MPELPEVEAARRAIEEHCVGKRITRAVVADDPKVIDGVTPSLLQSSLSSRTILAALRKGKNLWLRLDSPPFPSFQFGMAGAVYIKGVAVTKYKRSAVSDEEEWPSKFSKVFLELEDGLELSFTDKRRFARVRLLQNPETAPPISELGLDALLELMQVDEFATSLRHKKISIKALLLDQRYISGIGNWIADEVLYQAKIHPLELASNLTKERCESLHKCIKEVIRYAVEVDADSSRFPFEWLFHFRWGKKMGKVNGMKIEFITAGGRTSAFVPELQKLSTKSGKAPAISRKPKTGRDAGKEESHDEPEELEEREEQVSEKASAKKRKVKNGQTTKGAKKAAAKKETQPSSEKPGQDRPKKTVQNVREQTEEIKGEDKEEKEEQKSAKKRNQATKKAAQKKKVRK